MDELTGMIDKLVEQKTFSLDAVGQIKDLRDKAAVLEKKLASATDTIRRREIENTQKDGEICRRDTEIANWRKREAELKERESKVTTLERETAVAKAVHAETKEMMKMVFANRHIRETVCVNGSRSEMSPQGYTQSAPYNHTQTVEREEG